jgi:L-rhamnose isomerase
MTKPIGLDQEIQARKAEIDAKVSNPQLEELEQTLAFAMHSWSRVSGITLGTKETIEAMLTALAIITDIIREQS